MPLAPLDVFLAKHLAGGTAAHVAGKSGNIPPVSLLYRFVGDEVTSLKLKEKLETPHVVSYNF